jgi:formylmethanofuran dehydrogenase subunit E
MRVCLRRDAFEADPKYFFLSEKVQNDEASPKELAQFRKLQQARVQKVLGADAESIFKIKEISIDIPPKARIVESGTCDFCKEPTKIDRLRESNGRKLCIPCIHRTQPSA